MCLRIWGLMSCWSGEDLVDGLGGSSLIPHFWGLGAFYVCDGVFGFGGTLWFARSEA